MLSLAAMRAWRLPRVTMFIQYLYRDEPQLSRFQTGLVFADDRWKPSLQAFRLPFAQMGRHGERAIVWGQIRDGRPGRKTYRLEVLAKNVWKPIGRDRLTNDHGVFIRTIRVKRGALLPGLVAEPAALQPAAADQVNDEGRRAAPLVTARLRQCSSAQLQPVFVPQSRHV